MSAAALTGAAEALAFLRSLSPAGTRLGLEPTHQALTAIGHPERAYRTLHVAGTNGKGSTCAFAASCLRAQGYRVGLYTSPHLVRLNERIAVDGVDVSDAELAAAVLEVTRRYPEALATPAPLTFFEFTTLVALWHFAERKVDVAVLETGLGGRLDATNAVASDVTAVTSVSFDHQEYLGSTLEQIAAEKGGIFKARVPAVVSAQQPQALAVLRQISASVGAPMLYEGEQFALADEPGQGLFYRSARRAQPLGPIVLGLEGPHQRHNAATALACLEQLASVGLKVEDEALLRGLAQTRWPGRLERVAAHPEVVLDGAHNPDGARALAAALVTLTPRLPVDLVFGVLADKDHGPMIDALFPLCRSVQLTPVPSPRSLDPAALLPAARKRCSQVAVHATPADALMAARAIAGAEGRVVVAGSLYLIGCVRPVLTPG